MTLPSVQCGVCGKPVERLVVHRDESLGRTCIVACCHGQKDLMEMPDHFLASLNGHHEIIGAVAFSQKLVTP